MTNKLSDEQRHQLRDDDVPAEKLRVQRVGTLVSSVALTSRISGGSHCSSVNVSNAPFNSFFLDALLNDPPWGPVASPGAPRNNLSSLTAPLSSPQPTGWFHSSRNQKLHEQNHFSVSRSSFSALSIFISCSLRMEP